MSVARGGWQAQRNMIQRAEYLFAHPDFYSDVTFVFDPSTAEEESANVVKAHRFLLAAASEVFEAMFYGSIAETGTSVKVPDIEISAFKEIMRYIYTDKVDLTKENVEMILYGAHKYALLELVDRCGTFIVSQLSPINAAHFLQIAQLYDLQSLNDACLAIIDASVAEVLKSDSFLQIDKSTLALILGRELVVAEYKFFDALLRWAEQRCRKDDVVVSGSTLRERMGEALYLIRYGLMSLEQFVKVTETGVLTDSEALEIFKSFGSAKKPWSKFNYSPRDPSILGRRVVRAHRLTVRSSSDRSTTSP